MRHRYDAHCSLVPNFDGFNSAVLIVAGNWQGRSITAFSKSRRSFYQIHTSNLNFHLTSTLRVYCYTTCTQSTGGIDALSSTKSGSMTTTTFGTPQLFPVHLAVLSVSSDVRHLDHQLRSCRDFLPGSLSWCYASDLQRTSFNEIVHFVATPFCSLRSHLPS